MKFVRILALIVMVAVLAGIIVSHAAAQDNSPSNVNVPAETETIRDLLDQAMRAYRLGDFVGAFKLSRGAYLDHFENIELPLRTMDPDLTSDMEYRFADLRTKMQAGAPAPPVETAARSLRSGPDEIDPLVSGACAPAPTFWFSVSFPIIFPPRLGATRLLCAPRCSFR